MTDASASLPLVAVVTPVYNGAEFLEGAIRAVKAQTYPHVVHVLLDNASTDGTADIIARYAGEAGANVIVKRNAETLPQAKNFNKAVTFVPPEAAWFTMLCADDELKPNAIAEMVALAARDPNLVLIGGQESVNGSVRPSYLPETSSIYESSNAAARILSDDMRPSFPHALFRRDFLREGEDFFDGDFVAFDTEVALRILSQGGRFGFVHKHLFNNLHHEGALTATLVRKKIPYIWEQLLFIERYGPACLSNSEYKRLRKRHLRIVNRRMLFWMFTAPENFKRDLARLNTRDAAPTFASICDALLSWPAHLIERRFVKSNTPPVWAEDAVQTAPSHHRENAEPARIAG